MPDEANVSEHSEVSGEGVVEDGAVKSVGETVGTFRVQIVWAENEDQRVQAAQEWVNEFVKGVNSQEASDVPTVIKEIRIIRN